MAQGGSNNKVANKLVAASCAAVLAVYTAGYARTQSAANRLAAQVAERRAAVPAPERVVFQGPGHPSSAPIPERFRPPAAERTRNIIPRAEAEPPHVPGQAETKVEVLTSVAEPAHSETPEPPPLVAQVVIPAPAVAVAPTPALPPAPAPAPAKPVWKDGTYTGWGYSRHGNIEAAVVIEGGRIASASISQCRTRYSCDVIDKLIPQVAQRQSPDVDYVSGATQSADAFYGAVVEALSKAK
jgi:uncharacterized protein with FMN-binding domain